MNTLDPAGEWLRIAEHYRQLSDSELLVLARQQSELTEFAQQALAHEISHRSLKIEPEEHPEYQPDQTPAPTISDPPPDSSGPSDSTYAADRTLVRLCTVWSLPDALQLQTLLDRAGIPFFMGPEKATGVDAVTSNFANGVDVQIMSIGMPWAMQAMRNYTPENEPPEEQVEPVDIEVRCPKCNSTEVVFDRLIQEPTAESNNSAPIYQWICDSCGHQWEDDGLIKDE